MIRISTISTLSPIAAEIISNISRFGDKELVNNVVDELLDYFSDLCEESRAENVSQEKRVFQDILLPKVLKSNKTLGGAILGLVLFETLKISATAWKLAGETL